MAVTDDKYVSEANRAAGTRLELLLFHLGGRQLFGINVFKVQEIIPYQQVTKVPGKHPLVCGIATLRGITMPILDLAAAIGKPPLGDLSDTYIIVSEYNRSVHGFLVKGVDRIVNTAWDKVLPPPKGSGRNTFVTAVTLLDGAMVEILDVEKILDSVVHANTDLSAETAARAGDGVAKRVLVVDDSSVARTQIERALAQIGVECVTAKDGKDAMALLQQLVAGGEDPREHFAMVISDIEMPEKDGYQLTTEIRAMPEAEGLYILLHSSISGVFNVDMVRRTGANRFIQKYHPDDLANAVLETIGAG